MNKPNKVIVHCAFTPDSKKSKFSVDDVRRWHVEDNGWRDIGYHWYMSRSGRWYSGRPEDQRGAHSGKKGNPNSLGICYEGTWLPTAAQIVGFWRKYQDLKRRYGIDHNEWYGHYQYKPSKTCPGFSIELLKALFKAKEVNGNC